MIRLNTVLYACLIAAQVKAQDQPGIVVLEPGIGRFENGLSFVEVTETEDGIRVHAHMDPSAQPPEFLAGFEPADTWKLLEIKERRGPGIGLDIFFNPYGGIGGVGFGKGSVHLSPKNPFFVSVLTNNFPCPTCPEDLIVEYSVRVVDPPIPGDFNFDNRVGFDDFLALSTWIAHEPDTNRWPVYQRGDADLDADIDFDDFQILAENFGAVRETNVVVPEPSSRLLLRMALLGFGASYCARCTRSLDWVSKCGPC